MSAALRIGLENLPLLSMLQQRQDWLYVSYEDLILNSAGVIDYLADQLQLEDRNAMCAQLKQPSRSSGRESTGATRQLILKQDRQQLVNSWRAQFDDDQLQQAFGVLNRFGITLYRPDQGLPDHQRLDRQGFI